MGCRVSVLEWGRGEIKERRGNLPEGCVNPMDFVELAKSSVKLGKKKGLPIVVEYMDKSGRSKTMALLI